MIVAEPTGLLQTDFTLTDTDGSGVPFGEIALRLLRGGRLTVGDADYAFDSVGLMRQGVDLEQGTERLATARRPSVFRRATVVTFTARTVGTDADLVVDLLPEGWFGRRWTVAVDGAEIGRADWSGGFRPRLTLDVPDVLPLVVRAFLAVVLVVQRRNERRNG